ncbi:TraX family protein [Lactococcus garvieae]|uniref:TraX family protein n=1 Tax=Lactococcus garvieae TaxID=1363 RepID=UPI00385496AC
MKQHFGLSSYQLKIIAIIFMVLDHIYLEVLFLMPGIPDFSVLDMAARFVSPLFFFLMVEGFFYTRSRQKYFNRLLIGGVVMAIGNAITHLIMNVPITFFAIVNPNVFLSLAGGFGIIWILDTIIEKKKWLLIFPLILVTFLTLMTEASVFAVVLSYVMYASRKTGKKWILYVGTLLLSAFFLQQALAFGDATTSLWHRLSIHPQFLMFTVLPFIYFYNGKKGGSGSLFEKYFFYIFYPVHIWILFIIGQLLSH